MDYHNPIEGSQETNQWTGIYIIYPVVNRGSDQRSVQEVFRNSLFNGEPLGATHGVPQPNDTLIMGISQILLDTFNGNFRMLK